MSLGPFPPTGDKFDQLLREARAGSRQAVGQLLDAFRRYLHGLGEAEIVPDLRPKGSGSDLVQETFVAAIRAFPQFRGDSREALWVWLRTILMRKGLSFRRHYHGRSKRQLTRELSLNDDSTGGQVREGLAARTPSPSVEVIRSEQVAHLQAAVQALPAVYRRVVILRSRDRLSFGAIGRELDCSAEAARKLWTRALRCVASAIQD